MIRVDSLSVHYGELTAFRDVSICFPQGQITAIVGPSGCGKSSLLMALNRMTDLIPGARVSGTIMVDCCDVNDKCRTPTELRRCVGMIFQKPNPFPMSIRRNIELGLREHGERNKSVLKSIIEKALKDVGLWDEVKDRLSHSALTLSGGQQQRLCIARALALQPRVLLMDEPCSSLDPIASAKVESLIDELRGQYTIAIVTHNLAQARRISDRLVVFWVRNGCGEIVEQGPTDVVFSTPEDSITTAYLAGTHG